MERKPNITLSSLDLDRIESLLEKNNSSSPAVMHWRRSWTVRMCSTPQKYPPTW